jgi:hypothetical protein
MWLLLVLVQADSIDVAWKRNGEVYEISARVRAGAFPEKAVLSLACRREEFRSKAMENTLSPELLLIEKADVPVTKSGCIWSLRVFIPGVYHIEVAVDRECQSSPKLQVTPFQTRKDLVVGDVTDWCRSISASDLRCRQWLEEIRRIVTSEPGPRTAPSAERVLSQVEQEAGRIMFGASREKLAWLARDIASKEYLPDNLPEHKGPIQPSLPPGGIHRQFDSEGADPEDKKDKKDDKPEPPASGGAGSPPTHKRSSRVLEQFQEKLKPLQELMMRESESVLLSRCLIPGTIEDKELRRLAELEKGFSEIEPAFTFESVRKGVAALSKDKASPESILADWRAVLEQLRK